MVFRARARMCVCVCVCVRARALALGTAVYAMLRVVERVGTEAWMHWGSYGRTDTRCMASPKQSRCPQDPNDEPPLERIRQFLLPQRHRLYQDESTLETLIQARLTSRSLTC